MGLTMNAMFWLGADGDFDIHFAKFNNLMRDTLIERLFGLGPFTPDYCRPVMWRLMRIVGHLNPEIDESKIGTTVITLDYPMTAAEALAMEEIRPIGWRYVFRYRHPSADDSDANAPRDPETDAAEVKR